MALTLRLRSEPWNSARRQASNAFWSPGSASGQTVESSRASCWTVTGTPARASSPPPASAPGPSTKQQATMPASAARMASAGGLERVLDQEVGDLASHAVAHLQRIAEMDAAPDAHFHGFGGDLLDLAVAALQLGIHQVSDDDGVGRLGPEHRLQNAHRYAGDDAGLRRILGMHGHGIERGPAGIALGGVVAVLVAVADGRDRTPEMVDELGVPVGDEGVGHAHVEQREEPGIVGHGQLLLGRQLTGDLLPCRPEVELSPELDCIVLLRRALGAPGTTQLLGLVVVARVERALEIRRRVGPHLIGAL